MIASWLAPVLLILGILGIPVVLGGCVDLIVGSMLDSTDEDAVRMRKRSVILLVVGFGSMAVFGGSYAILLAVANHAA